MGRECAGTRIMFGGLIVLLVGLVVALVATMRIPGYWTPALVGAALILVGALRRAVGGSRPPSNANRQ